MDAASLDAIHRSAFGHAGAHGWHKADFEKALQANDFAIVASDRGYAVARAVGDEAELLLIATRSDARRGGIATSLLGDLEARLRDMGSKRLFLEVHEGNAAALAFYAGVGFSTSGRRRNYYGRGAGHDAVLMEKSLVS